jgi:hypothetical protein
MNLNFPFIFPERIKHFSYQDPFKASYSSRHFYFSPVRHFSIARHKYRRLRHLFFNSV